MFEIYPFGCINLSTYVTNYNIKILYNFFFNFYVRTHMELKNVSISFLMYNTKHFTFRYFKKQ